jgi:hypothetical protein
MFFVTSRDRYTLIQNGYRRWGEAYDRSVRSFVKLPGRPEREAIASHKIVPAKRDFVDVSGRASGIPRRSK